MNPIIEKTELRTLKASVLGHFDRVALKAGVDKATVSRVLNDTPQNITKNILSKRKTKTKIVLRAALKVKKELEREMKEQKSQLIA